MTHLNGKSTAFLVINGQTVHSQTNAYNAQQSAKALGPKKLAKLLEEGQAETAMFTSLLKKAKDEGRNADAERLEKRLKDAQALVSAVKKASAGEHLPDSQDDATDYAYERIAIASKHRS